MEPRELYILYAYIRFNRISATTDFFSLAEFQFYPNFSLTGLTRISVVTEFQFDRFNPTFGNDQIFCLGRISISNSVSVEFYFSAEIRSWSFWLNFGSGFGQTLFIVVISLSFY